MSTANLSIVPVDAHRVTGQIFGASLPLVCCASCPHRCRASGFERCHERGAWRTALARSARYAGHRGGALLRIYSNATSVVPLTISRFSIREQTPERGTHSTRSDSKPSTVLPTCVASWVELM